MLVLVDIERARRHATPAVVKVLSRYPVAPPGEAVPGSCFAIWMRLSEAASEILLRQPGRDDRPTGCLFTR